MNGGICRTLEAIEQNVVNEPCAGQASDSSPSRAFSAVAATALQPSTRFATADLVASVLHLDFWDDGQPSTIFFAKLASEIVSTHLEIPEKVTRTIKMHLV
ncbi:hypothetical protein TELCIR_17701, partial [Teladorsagia circumcincta]